MKKILLYLVVLIASIGLYVGLYFFYLPDLARSTFEDKRDSLETSIKRQIKDAWNNKNALLYFKDYGRAMKNVLTTSVYALLPMRSLSVSVLILCLASGIVIGSVGSGIAVRKYVKV